MGVTTDSDDPNLRRTRPDGQRRAYLVLSDAERARGFVRPVRRAYRHPACGQVTGMSDEIAETYARDPTFYGRTFCRACGAHFPLQRPDGSAAFVRDPDGSTVGS